MPDDLLLALRTKEQLALGLKIMSRVGTYLSDRRRYLVMRLRDGSSVPAEDCAYWK